MSRTGQNIVVYHSFSTHILFLTEHDYDKSYNYLTDSGFIPQ